MSFDFVFCSVFSHCLVAYWTIRRQTNLQSVKSQTGELAETFDLKFAVNKCYKCDCSKLCHWTLSV